MGALRAGRRNGTARELAEKLGVSPRTIQSYMALPRDQYLSEARERRQQIRQLRATGMSMRAIAAEIGCSVATVHRAINRVEA